MPNSTRAIASLAVLTLLAACGDGATGPAYTPTFSSVPCWDEVTDPDVTCGYVAVPENRGESTGRQVRLAVARLAARTDAPGAPVIYLHGGPGGQTLSGLSGWRGSTLRNDRELILMDQRGSGFSQPSLNCPELEDATWQTFSQTGDLEGEIAIHLGASAACRDRLLADGVDLSQFDTPNNAHDVADVRRALGIEEWNLFGVSYGTSLALEVMRSHPDGIRSVILDSNYPPDQALTTGREADTADRALGALDAGCARSSECTTLMEGSLIDYLYATIAEFDADPYELEAVNQRTGETFTLRLDGADVFAGIFNALYDINLVAIMPTVLQQVRSRNPVFLQTAADDGVNRIVSANEMAFIAIECRDRGRNWSLSMVRDLLADRPELTTLYAVFAATHCEVVDVGNVDRSFNEPVVSDIPTIVMGGEFDPITPPEWGRDQVQHLSRGTYFEYPGMGHAAVFSDACPASMALAFLRDPASPPDASCIADMNVPFP